MKPYGLPREDNWKYPDMGDARDFGLKSSSVKLKGKGGDIRSHCKSSANKRATRRIQKRRARNEGKAACNLED